MNAAIARDLVPEVQRILTTAGVALAVDGAHPRDGVLVGVADMRVHGGQWAVMLSWGSVRGDALGQVVDVALAAVAEVLRLRGFAVERHPVGEAWTVTGRRVAVRS